MKYVVLFLVCAHSIIAQAQSKDEKAITQMLKAQEAAWNEGSLEKFMIGYWQNDSLMFIGKNGPTYGYNNTLANYKKGYPDTSYMGKFTSTIIGLKKLSANYYFVTGKWFLKRSVGDAKGYYTLLLRKINGKWVIVADHSS
ncbi:MAG: nuclear transport factor 2 family protein [Chitinophagaceae bacterium]|jgi:ketosteroid isomerase-like protein|nr:nuclear transport factor 2 family protein [Chitinophagaceae bacterium]